MKQNHDYTKICFRLSNKDNRQRRALEILQTRSWQLKQSYAQSVTEAILAYFDEARLSDDELADKIAEQILARLPSITSVVPHGDSAAEKTAEPAASMDEIDDADIDWDFLGG